MRSHSSVLIEVVRSVGRGDIGGEMGEPQGAIHAEPVVLRVLVLLLPQAGRAQVRGQQPVQQRVTVHADCRAAVARRLAARSRCRCRRIRRCFAISGN